MAGEGPLWEAVYDGVRERIELGELAPGAQVPGELALCTEYGVSRPTVRTALGRLEAQGLITTGDGRRGRKVREFAPCVWHVTEWEPNARRRDDPARGIDAWAADMAAQGKEPRQVISVQRIAAPLQIAAWLNIEPHTMVVRRRRIRIAAEEPVTIADSWFPADIAELECEVDGRMVKPVMVESDVVVEGGFVRAMGITQVRFLDEIRVRMPSPDEEALLDVGPGTPVGEHARVGIDDTGRRIRVIVSVFPGSRMYLAYELEA